MSKIEIQRYDSSLAGQWDQVVDLSRNGTFLHKRGYMDYHKDRFDDHSLLATDGKRLIAVMPACRQGDVLASHGGLTYGGWLMPAKHIDATVMLNVMEQTLDHMRSNNLAHLVYNPVPHIYHRYPAEEDLYALWRCGARIDSVRLSTVIDLHKPLPLDRGSRAAAHAARRNGVTIQSDDAFGQYWALLTDVLDERFGATPVHTLDEITLLHDRFSENIRLYSARIDGRMVAGVLMFLAGPVARCQYIAASPEGRDAKALPLLFEQLIASAAGSGFRYFDFGTSNEQGGRVLNTGLVQQKSRLGGRGIIYPSYRIDLDPQRP